MKPIPITFSSSAVQSGSGDDSSTEDEHPQHLRGRRYTMTRNQIPSKDENLNQRPSYDLSGAQNWSRPRLPFTRSRSPAVAASAGLKGSSNSTFRSASPSIALSRLNRSTPGVPSKVILPGSFDLTLKIWFHVTWHFCIDGRRATECFILLLSLLYGARQISSLAPKSASEPNPCNSNAIDLSTSLELYTLCIASFLYIIWSHSSISFVRVISNPITSTHPQSPATKYARSLDSRDVKRQPAPLGKKSDFGFIWMSVPKNYRESSDDGILTALLLGPLIAATLLYSSLQGLSDSGATRNPLPSGWLIEPPAHLSHNGGTSSALCALVLSRYNLVDLATCCSTILLLHVVASWWLETRHTQSLSAPDGERASVPRSEALRFWYYILFVSGVSCGLFGAKILLKGSILDVWQHMSSVEVLLCSMFYQLTLYAALRLAHRGFTLGELGLVCFGGIALFMELLNITLARMRPITTPFIKTYRLPTPLLIFQLALIAGSFFTGFLLSPFLVLSRHIAQRPVRRLRYPEDKQRHRRYLALGFYVGSVLIIGGLIGMWARWCLGQRDPWLWVIFRLFEGRRQWSRPALLAYWALLGSLSVAGWNRQLARSRRHRSRNAVTDNSQTSDCNGPAQTPDPWPPSQPSSASAAPLSLTFPNLSNLPNLPNGAIVASELLDAADKHVPTLSLNARRKFFHALAVVMFVPGVAFDPAFTHLSFSVAFALFTFAEYVRYFAVYPFGAAIHVFMHDFLDHKDSGTAILSHFYLLTGCAGTVWLEGATRLSQFTGVLVLGVGDALASIVGKRIGSHRWSPTTSKTVEGSVAFTVSIVVCAWVLRVCGVVEPFSTLEYGSIVAISSMLEALSVQNDNLTLPLFMWCLWTLW